MSDKLTDEENHFLQTLAEREGFQNYNIEGNIGTVKGDNYMGVIKMVVIKERHNQKELNLVLKAAHTQVEFRKQAPVEKAYIREVRMYEKVFPDFREFQLSKNIEYPFNSVAKYFGHSLALGKEFLILENLLTVGYKLWSRKEPMNADHISLVLSEYGKYHALSLAIKDQQPERFAHLTKDFHNIFDINEMDKQFANAFKSALMKITEMVKGDPHVEDVWEKFVEEKSVSIFSELTQKKSQYDVITHGDCWNNNMMFKYENEKNPRKPTGMAFLDFQVSVVGSPIYDLSYFFYACGSKEIFNDYKTYFKIYHNSLSDMLRQLGSDPEKLFPYNDFEKEWKRCSIYGLRAAMFIIKIMLTEVKDVPDMAEIAESGNSVMEAFVEGFTVQEEYSKRMKDIVTFMVYNDFL